MSMQASNLIDSQRDEFWEDIAEEYEEIREDHYASLQDRKYMPLTVAREKGFNINWTESPKPVKPTFLGKKLIESYDLKRISKYIDWNPFFQVWYVA